MFGMQEPKYKSMSSLFIVPSLQVNRDEMDYNA